MPRIFICFMLAGLLAVLAGCSSKPVQANAVTDQKSTASFDVVRKSVKEKVQQIAEATLNGNYEAVADLTNAKVIDILGGRKKMIELIKLTLEQVKSEGVSLQSVEVGEPGDFYFEGENAFVLVPLDMIMKIHDGKIVGKSFQLGISSDGMKTWTFIEAEIFHNDKTLFNQLKIKLPQNFKIPDEQDPEIILNSGKAPQLSGKDAEIAKIVKKKLQEINQATMDGNYEDVIDLTYPKVVALQGGRKKAIEGVKKTMKDLEAKGMKFLSYTVDDPEFFSYGDKVFALIPTTAIVKVAGGKIIVREFDLGISSDNKKTWSFIHGTALYNKVLLDKLDFKLPPDMKLPEKQKPEMIPD